METQIPKTESQETEFKKSLAMEDNILTACVALSNANGGTIFIGIDDNGVVVGADIGKNTIENLAKKMSEQITPKIYPRIDVIEINDKKIIAIVFKESAKKPHFFRGIAYKRVGIANLKIDPAELEILFVKKHSEKIRFDSQPASAGLDSIDEVKVESFFSLAKKAKRVSGDFEGTEHTLKNLGLIDENGKLLNSAILLFGKNPSAAFPQHGFRCAVQSGEEFADFRFFPNDIFTMIEEVYDFVILHIPKRIRIEGTKRVEDPIIPGDVIREAIINSIIHRDYHSSASNYLSISKDHIEINNPGELPPALHIDDLFKAHRSIPRNPFLAKVAFLADYIEQWGTGTRKMVTLMRENGLDDPIFEEKQGFFSVRLFSTSLELNPRVRWAIDFAKERGEIRSRDIMKEFKMTSRTALSDLDWLVKKGFLKRKGKKRGSYYTL